MSNRRICPECGVSDVEAALVGHVCWAATPSDFQRGKYAMRDKANSAEKPSAAEMKELIREVREIAEERRQEAEEKPSERAMMLAIELDERCPMSEGIHTGRAAQLIDRALRQQREECAKICDELARKADWPICSSLEQAATEIRAVGEKRVL